MSWIPGARVKVIDDPHREHINVGYKGTIVEVHRNGTWISVALDVNKRSEEKYLQFKKRWLALVTKDTRRKRKSSKGSSGQWEPNSFSRDVLPAPKQKEDVIRNERGSYRDRQSSSRDKDSYNDRNRHSADRIPYSRDREPFSNDRKSLYRDRFLNHKERKPSSRETVFSYKDRNPSSRDKAPLSRDQDPSIRDKLSSRDRVSTPWDNKLSSRGISSSRDRLRNEPLSSKERVASSRDLPAPDDGKNSFRDKLVAAPREKVPSPKRSRFEGWFGRKKPTVTKANPKSTVSFVCPVDDFTVHDVTIWLEDAGWGDYVECFFLADIDGKSLRNLNDRSLKKLKVLPQHRPKMIADIKKLISAPVGLEDELKTDISEPNSPAISLKSTRTDRKSERSSSSVEYFERNPYTFSKARRRGPLSDRSNSSVPESIAASINSSYSIASSIAELESLRDRSKRRQRDKERRTLSTRSNQFKE